MTNYLYKRIQQRNAFTKVFAPWYIEAMFYSDSTFTTTFGGSYERMNYPLEPNVEAYWQITHSSDAIIESEYPNHQTRSFTSTFPRPSGAEGGRAWTTLLLTRNG